MLIGWEGYIQVDAMMKKGYSSGKIELSEKRGKVEVCKILAW